MLLAKNRDVPGVIGKIGTILGNYAVNISGYILSKSEQGQAFSVIRTNSLVNEKIVQEILNLKEIISLQQVSCENSFINE